MATTLAERVSRLKDDFFSAARQGPAAIAVFNTGYADLRRELLEASEAGTLPAHVRDLARSSATCIVEHARILCNLDSRFVEIAQEAASSEDGESDLSAPSSTASLPLFRYFMANICHPYPDSEAKERVAREVREAGWHDFDKKKFEDWLNRKRVQCGFVSILRTHCGGDREEMSNLCRVALAGSDEDKARLPDGALEEFEDMRDLVQSQHDDLIDAADATWVDELATGIQAVVDRSAVDRDAQRSRTSYDDDIVDVNDVVVDYDYDYDYDDDDDDDDDDDESDSASASEWSETDVEDVEDEDTEPARPVIGAKRKFTDTCDSSSFITSRPPSRSLSMVSSSSSNSSFTACSVRSISGSSLCSTTSVDWEGDDERDRPAKRSRSDSCSFDATSMASTSTPETGSPASAAMNDLFTTYQSKRRRLDGGLNSRTRALKRSRYAALGVVSQAGNIHGAHLASLSGFCSLDWTPVETVALALEADLYTVDCSQPGDDGSEVEDFAVLVDREDDESANDILTWSKLQICDILRMLLSAQDQPPPVSPTQSVTYAFDIDTRGVPNASALEETMKLTPEALSAMFDAMNGFEPAPAQESVSPDEGPVVPSSDDALLVLEASVPTLDAPALSPDALARSGVAPSLGALASAVDSSTLRIDTSAAAQPASVSEVALSPREESFGLGSSSSSDSEGDSPPALSDDSGSSSRSSSPEPDSERDSLSMSPATLSADYSHFNDELLATKASNTDPSQFHVEFGALPELTTADASSCASELLERYLNDPTIWA